MSSRVIQNIFSAYEKQLENIPQPLKNRKAIYALAHCRTREMGVRYYACADGHEGIEQFHSCRHRSCYVCAQQKRVEWIEAQKKRLLDTAHFHVVFTLPHEYLPLWRYNEALFARLLFKASQQSLLELLAVPKHGGYTPGILMTLHTWGRQLTLHPHMHCLVTAGGVTANGEWQASGEFLLPGAVLRSLYRGKVQAYLREAFARGELRLPPDMTPSQFWVQYRALYQKNWNVRIEERYAHGRGVLLYLARYCKGGPLNPAQIHACDSRGIEMSYFDHRSQRSKRQTLAPMTFIARLLQHVPAAGVHTVRYYGLYAPASRRRHARCVARLGTVAGQAAPAGSDREAMLLYCRTCGHALRFACQYWPLRHVKRWGGKGNSINKAVPGFGAGGSVQPGVEVDIANGLHVNSS